MLVGIVADTHDNMDKIKVLVHVCNSKQVEMVLHAGDFCSPFTLWEFKKLHSAFVSVFGNNDGERIGLQEKIQDMGGQVDSVQFEGEIDGRKVYMTHYPKIAVPVAHSRLYDLVVCGHNHKIAIETFGSTLLVNPGEACGWISGRATMVLLDTRTMITEILDL